jgi:ribosomal protein L23
MADLHKRSVQEAVNLSVGGKWSVATVATHGGTANTNTIHFSVDENTSQIGVYSAVELYFNFSTTTTDVTVANDMIIPASTLVFLTTPRGLGDTLYFNHLGKGSAGAVRIVEI